MYIFLDKMSFYTEVYKTKPNDVISRDDETLWRRQAPKLLYPLGVFRLLVRINRLMCVHISIFVML